jgi:hypothetical protein
MVTQGLKGAADCCSSRSSAAQQAHSAGMLMRWPGGRQLAHDVRHGRRVVSWTENGRALGRAQWACRRRQPLAGVMVACLCAVVPLVRKSAVSSSIVHLCSGTVVRDMHQQRQSDAPADLVPNW